MMYVDKCICLLYTEIKLVVWENINPSFMVEEAPMAKEPNVTRRVCT